MSDAKPGTLAGALAQLQGRLPHVAKANTATVDTKAGGQYRYAYADLTDVSKVLLPVMSALGLSFSARPTMEDGHFVLVYDLRADCSDEIIRGSYPLPEQGGPQDIGKAITYARRYALCAVTGLAPGGDDDDAQAAQDAHRDRPERKPRTVPDAQLAAEGRMTRQQVREHERLEADVKKRKPGEQKAARSRGMAAEDPWAGRPPEERENAPGTVNDLQLRAIWMLLKKQGIEDPATGHAMARTALALDVDALWTDPDPETGEVRESFKRLSHTQAAAFIGQLQGGGDV